MGLRVSNVAAIVSTFQRLVERVDVLYTAGPDHQACSGIWG